jgi:hypothetical protein
MVEKRTIVGWVLRFTLPRCGACPIVELRGCAAKFKVQQQSRPDEQMLSLSRCGCEA